MTKLLAEDIKSWAMQGIAPTNFEAGRCMASPLRAPEAHCTGAILACDVNVMLPAYSFGNHTDSPDGAQRGLQMTEAAASAFHAQYMPPFVQQPVAIRTPEVSRGAVLTLEQELIVTKHLAEVAPLENIRLEAFDKALRIMQKLLRGSTTNAMPTAMKLKSWEVPLLQYALEYSAKSPENRRIVVRRLVENLETGTGFFSINRSKQGLKVIAKKTGLSTLESEIESDKDDVRRTAAHLLGWMKHEKAVLPLLKAYCQGARSDRRIVGRVLKLHYSHLAPFYAHRFMPDSHESIVALINSESEKSVDEPLIE